MKRGRWIGGLAAAALLCACAGAPAPSVGAEAFFVDSLAEKVVTALPEGPLYWRLERFDSLAEAERAAGPTSLAAEASGGAWLATLGPAGGASVGTAVAEIGPVPAPTAERYLLRLNHAGGPPGAQTPVHRHAGAEAFYVLSGQLTQRTAHGVARLEAGETMPGHEPGMVMQLTSSGEAGLDQLVLFVVDADQPFSTPASFAEAR